MKKNKPNKKDILCTPCKTIADLKFDWTILSEMHEDTFLAQEKIKTKNPHLAGLKIVPNSYKFIVNGTDDVIYIDNTYIDSSLRNLISFFEYLCWKLCWVSGLTGRFSHFERIDDQTYRIHMKKKS
jgi:hypothetical protein